MHDIYDWYFIKDITVLPFVVDGVIVEVLSCAVIH